MVEKRLFDILKSIEKGDFSNLDEAQRLTKILGFETQYERALSKGNFVVFSDYLKLIRDGYFDFSLHAQKIADKYKFDVSEIEKAIEDGKENFWKEEPIFYSQGVDISKYLFGKNLVIN